MTGRKTIHAMTVTSPHTRGPEVKRRQKLLFSNVFKQNFMGVEGAIDGDFGPETGRAVIRAKFWLGYTQKEMTPIYGPFLDAFLAGRTKLPADHAKRRATRLKAKDRKPLREKAFERAVKDLGMKESPPNSNWSPISRRWRMKGPWCAMGVSEWYLDVGSKSFRERRDFAYVPFMLAAAERGEHGLAIVRAGAVRHGDVVCFDWDDDQVADHTGLFDRFTDQSHFKTIEANTAVGNDSNGGEVMRRDRSLSQVSTFNRAPAFIRVGR